MGCFIGLCSHFVEISSFGEVRCTALRVKSLRKALVNVYRSMRRECAYLQPWYVPDGVVENDRPKGGVDEAIHRRISARFLHHRNRNIVDVA